MIREQWYKVLKKIRREVTSGWGEHGFMKEVGST